MAWMRTYDITTPDGSVDSPAEAADRMNEIKFATQEREDIDHYWPLTGTEVSDLEAGEHRKITLRSITAVAVAALAAAKAYLYHLVTDGELYFKDAAGNTIQFTDSGKILSASLDMKDEDNMISDSAVHTLSQQSSKAYADAIAAAAAAARVALTAAITAAHPAYAGGESHTDGSGLIMKMGVVACNVAAPKTVTFGVAFPNAIVAATLSMRTVTHLAFPLRLDSKSTANLVIDNANGVGCTAEWIAIGY